MNRNGLFGGVPIGSYFNEPPVYMRNGGSLMDRFRAADQASMKTYQKAFENTPGTVAAKAKAMTDNMNKRDNDDRPKVDKDALASILSGGASSVSPIAIPIYNPVMDDPYIVGDGEDLTPDYIKYQRSIIGQSYPTIISQGIGAAGEAIYADPINFGKGIASAAYQGGKDFLADSTGTIYNYGKGVLDSAKNIGTKSLSDYLPAGVDEFTATPEQMTEARKAKLSDYLNASALVPAAGVATAAAKTGGKLAVSAADNSRLAKSLRGGLGEEFYGLGGPKVAPNVGNFTVPTSYASELDLGEAHANLKAQGFSDYEIEELYGIKQYKTEGMSGDFEARFGTVTPSDEIDISNIDYTREKIPHAGVYYPGEDRIIISEKIDPKSSRFADIVRHEAEHQKQEAADLSDAFGAGGIETAYDAQVEALEKLNRQIREEKNLERKSQLIAERDEIAMIDAAGSYYNNPSERGARQAALEPFTTYDPSITSLELLDPSINIGKDFSTRAKESALRAVLPTYGDLSRFREMGPRIPFTDEKLFKGLAIAGAPFARMNIPMIPSTRGNKPVPYITNTGDPQRASYSEDKNTPVSSKEIYDILNRGKISQYNFRKKEIIDKGFSGDQLEQRLNNLARNLKIERPE